MLSFLRKTFDNTNKKQLKKYYKIVEKINALEPTFETYTDEQLKNKTAEWKEALHAGKTIDDIQIEAFAVVREASKRVLGMRHFDVQLIGGLVLSEGNIAEMATGEGKTLVASLASYLHALEDKGVHVITVNEYLARRDKEMIGKIHEFLGLTVGLNVPMMTPDEKKAAYQADITYGVGTEFGFDFLRDNMARSVQEQTQRPYHYAIIDEVDSVLIDEAKTPLIIAGKMEPSKDLHYVAARLAKKFKKNVDYHFDDETKATSLTEEGIEKVEQAFAIDNLYDLEHQTLYHYVIQAVRAHVMFERDVDYIIKDGKVMLVDMFTGRVMEGRSLSDGLHQAIEAKEGLEVTEENKTQASITIQNYFRMYPHLSGMTGTAKTEEKEFDEVYGMSVVQIPTNKPKIREDMPDKVFKTTDDKYKAVTNEVKKRVQTGQPVLVGTTSILQSEAIAKYFDKANIAYEILNAKSVEQEVRLISLAGQKGRVTIATNMAGRGTDILLGDGVAELGGLHVLGTERHESRRIDNQLKGRSGRQGDPGSSQFFISLEDEMFRRFAKDELDKLAKRMTIDKNGVVHYKKISEFVDRVQRIVEGANFSMREYNLKLDNVINQQRKIIYEIRTKMIKHDDLTEQFLTMLQYTIDDQIDQICSNDLVPEEWDLQSLENLLNELISSGPLPEEIDSKQTVIDFYKPLVEQQVTRWQSMDKSAELLDILKATMLSILDYHWIQHIEGMTRLKEGIGLRHYQQEDPMRLYEREGLELFTLTYNKISLVIARRGAQLFKSVDNTTE